MTLENGNKMWLRETGTYRFDDGRVFVVDRGRVIKRAMTAPRVEVKPNTRKEMILKGKKILEN